MVGGTELGGLQSLPRAWSPDGLWGVDLQAVLALGEGETSHCGPESFLMKAVTAQGQQAPSCGEGNLPLPRLSTCVNVNLLKRTISDSSLLERRHGTEAIMGFSALSYPPGCYCFLLCLWQGRRNKSAGSWNPGEPANFSTSTLSRPLLASPTVSQGFLYLPCFLKLLSFAPHQPHQQEDSEAQCSGRSCLRLGG